MGCRCGSQSFEELASANGVRRRQVVFRMASWLSADQVAFLVEKAGNEGFMDYTFGVGLQKKAFIKHLLNKKMP